MTTLVRTVFDRGGTQFEEHFVVSENGLGGITLHLSIGAIGTGRDPLISTMMLSREQRQALRLYLHETRHRDGA